MNTAVSSASDNTISVKSDMTLTPNDSELRDSPMETGFNCSGYVDPATFDVCSDGDRVKLLKSTSLSSEFKFPKKSQGRKYSLQWEKQYSWLRYSISRNISFCIMCKAFAHHVGIDVNEAGSKGDFVKSGFNDWKNAMGRNEACWFFMKIATDIKLQPPWL